MYSLEQRTDAVQLFIESGFNENAVIRNLGYPSPNTLRAWYREYQANRTLHAKSLPKPRYTEQQKKKAVEYFAKHNLSLKQTCLSLGYPTHGLLRQWIIEMSPELLNRRKKTCVQKKSLVIYSKEEKLAAVESMVINGIPLQYIHRELAKPGVTLTLLWEEYRSKCYETGKTPYMSTQFGDKYRKWARVTKATMRIQHKPGDAIQVDWAGDTIPIYDSVTGQQSSAYLFVAVLPCSYYAYTEACADMKTENWLNCHVHAFNYFGGVTRLLIPDNCKTATSSNTRYDTVLNRSYQKLADYYGTAIVPARVRRPKDKSSAEASVRFAETWIIAALRDRKFFSLQEVNEAVAEKLEELNSREFQQRTGTRRSAYLEEEQPYMLPLPATPFESAVWSVAKVPSDYLVSDGRNKYSVPYNLIGEKVDVRVTKNLVEVYYHGSRVASHRRLQTLQRDPLVKLEHMPEPHQKYLTYNEDDFKVWAISVGPMTEHVVDFFLESGKAPEQGYKACASLTKLGERYGKERLESACARVHAYGTTPSIRNSSSILKSKQDVKAKTSTAQEQSSNTARYGITRGASYFANGGEYK